MESYHICMKNALHLWGLSHSLGMLRLTEPFALQLPTMSLYSTFCPAQAAPPLIVTMDAQDAALPELCGEC